MSYKHLERIQSLMSTPSTSDFGVGHSTSRIKNNYEDGAGALARIKQDSNRNVAYVASIYCINDRHSRNVIRFLLHAKILEWFNRDNKEAKEHALPIANIALGKVFDGLYKTQEECGNHIGVVKSGYHKRYKQYVEDSEIILHELLSEAEIIAGNYKWDELNPKAIDTRERI